MGACFNEMTLDGKQTKQQVIAAFNERVEQDGYENGHSYSGSFSQFHGLVFTDKTFNTRDEAHDYVEQHGEKWGPAVAVRHKLYEVPKSAQNHNVQREKLHRKIWDANAALANAKQKARLNNRSSEPAYVTKAKEKAEKVKEQIQPKIDDRTAKIEAIIAATAAKSKKYVWFLGGWCSS